MIRYTLTMARRPQSKLKRTTVRSSKKKTAPLASPADEFVQDAVTLLMREQYESAIALLSKAVAQDWKHTKVRLLLARAYGQNGQLDECKQEIHRVVEIAKRQPEVIIEAGQALARFGEFDAAFDVFEKAHEVGTRNSQALTRMADAAERLSRLEDASTFATQAISHDTQAHEARLVLARVLRRKRDHGHAAEVLHEAISTAGATDQLRAKQNYELAAVLDQLGEYAKAAEALTNAKARLKESAKVIREPADEAAYTLRRLVQELSQERVAGWVEASRDMPPARVAALVGFPRSGTTLLEQVLDAHPEIVSVEESTHLSSELVAGMTRTVPKTESLAQTLDQVKLDDVQHCRKRYLDALSGHVGGGIGSRYVLDKNPIRTLVMPFLRRAIPNAKIITALRDPRDVVLSNLMQAFEPSAMNLAFLDVKEAGDFYALNMEGWIRLRSMIDDWVEVCYEDVVTDSSAQAMRVFELLGLEWRDEVARFRENMPDKAVRSPTYAAVQEPVHSRAVRRWENYAEYLAPAMPVLERVAKTLGYD